MYSEVLSQSSTNWIATTKDIALVILSGTAIIAGYIQSRKNRRAEWVKDFRIEMAKILAIGARPNVSEVEFSKFTIEHFSLISLYVDHNNDLHNQLLDEINDLVTTWGENRKGQKTKKEVNDVVVKITQTVKLIIDAEYRKL